MAQKQINISIIIPVKNGASTLDPCLTGIQKQTLFDQCEIIIIDSGSTDDTLKLIENYPVRLYQIPPSDFNHGATRNYGVSLAKGEFVVMTVQDATPANEYWLENMYRHFKDKVVAGVCGQQIVPHHPDKNPHLWFRPQSEPSIKYIQFKNNQEFLRLSPQEQKNVCGWDDVTAMYRKSVLVKLPFEPVMFGEDMMWARQALLNTHKLVYDTSARIEHYHHHYASYTYRRVLIVWLFIYKIFGYKRPNPIKAKDFLLVLYRNFKWRLPLKWIIHNWSLQYYFWKSVKDFNRKLAKNQLEKLEKQLALNLPQGKTNE